MSAPPKRRAYRSRARNEFPYPKLPAGHYLNRYGMQIGWRFDPKFVQRINRAAYKACLPPSSWVEKILHQALQRDRGALVGSSEIAAMAGATRQQVTNWKHRYADFPTPLVKLRAGPIYDKGQIIEWLKSRKP